MQAFPTKLRYMCICLSEVIFMEGFMRKIYSFINGLEVLHLIGNFSILYLHDGGLLITTNVKWIMINFFTANSNCSIPLLNVCWIGTYEKISEEEEEIYEVINIHKLKSATPNLRVVNMYDFSVLRIS